MAASDPTITVYAVDWCFDCRRARKFFDRNNIAYRWINIDREPEAEKYVLKVNRGNRSVPTIVFEDGSILVEPSETQLRTKLKISIGD